MSKPIELTEESWKKLHQRLLEEYPKSHVLIREKMRAKLGFVPRWYQEWVDVDDLGYPMKYPKTNIYLDFYDEPKRTMFMLKYSEFLEKPDLDIV